MSLKLILGYARSDINMLFFWFAEPIADDHSGCPKACASSLAVEISFFSLY